jgi:hypothetical protein
LGPYIATEGKQVQDIISILAYPNPFESSLHHLLSQKQREMVWNRVNRAILSSSGSGTVLLDRLVQQATVVREVLCESKERKVYPKWSLEVFLA